MARVAILDDYQAYGEMIAAPLQRGGHATQITTVPLDFERVLQFMPEVLVLSLYRREQAVARPITDFRADVLGADALAETESYPAVMVLPIVLLGHCVLEAEVPTRLPYDLFLTLPANIATLADQIVRVADMVKSRRKVSGYLCPTCGGRLLYVAQTQDLFCPRDFTSVVLIDEEQCLYRPDGHLGRSLPCRTPDLLPPPREV